MEDTPTNIALISFTGRGAKLCRSIAGGLEKKRLGYECKAFATGSFAEENGLLPVETSLCQWTKKAFSETDALIFVGACGIAVRAIAPYVKSKTQDPAVVVVDEAGTYAISLLSGHVGGANELTSEVAGIIGAEPVITTATDIHGLFAVDEWAKRQNLRIEDMTKAKEISAALLAGEEIGIVSSYPIEGSVPDRLVLYDEEGREELRKRERKTGLGIVVSSYRKEETSETGNKTEEFFQSALHLVPQVLTVGIGCRKDTPTGAISALLEKTFTENNLIPGAVKQICSIDLKENEKGIRHLAQTLKVPFHVYSAEELKSVAGDFTPSDFVREVTGVENVCERAAVLGSKGRLLIKKQAMNGVTLAVAIREEEYTWT